MPPKRSTREMINTVKYKNTRPNRIPNNRWNCSLLKGALSILFLLKIQFCFAAEYKAKYPFRSFTETTHGSPQHLSSKLLDESLFVPFQAYKLARPRILYMNYDLFRSQGMKDVHLPLVRKQLQEEVLSQLAYSVPGVFSPKHLYLKQSKTFWADRYYDNGWDVDHGSQRAGLIGEYSLKGIGHTPLAKDVESEKYHGELGLHEAIKDAAWSEVLYRSGLKGASRVLAIIDKDSSSTEADPDKRQVLLIREAPFRAGHVWAQVRLMNQNDNEKKSDLNSIGKKLRLQFDEKDGHVSVLIEYLLQFAENSGLEEGSNYANRFFHGADALSNRGANGKVLDFGTTSFNMGYTPIKFLDHIRPFELHSWQNPYYHPDVAKTLHLKPYNEIAREMIDEINPQWDLFDDLKKHIIILYHQSYIKGVMHGFAELTGLSFGEREWLARIPEFSAFATTLLKVIQHSIPKFNVEKEKYDFLDFDALRLKGNTSFFYPHGPQPVHYKIGRKIINLFDHEANNIEQLQAQSIGKYSVNELLISMAKHWNMSDAGLINLVEQKIRNKKLSTKLVLTYRAFYDQGLNAVDKIFSVSIDRRKLREVVYQSSKIKNRHLTDLFMPILKEKNNQATKQLVANNNSQYIQAHIDTIVGNSSLPENGWLPASVISTFKIDFERGLSISLLDTASAEGQALVLELPNELYESELARGPKYTEVNIKVGKQSYTVFDAAEEMLDEFERTQVLLIPIKFDPNNAPNINVPLAQCSRIFQ